jgi:hypothetical protein
MHLYVQHTRGRQISRYTAQAYIPRQPDERKIEESARRRSIGVFQTASTPSDRVTITSDTTVYRGDPAQSCRLLDR